MLTYPSDVHAPPEKIVEQILTIAPILPGSGQPKSSEPLVEQPTPTAKKAPSMKESAEPDSLIDLSSRPSSTTPPEPKADPIAGNPLHPTSNPKQAPMHQSTATPAPVGNPSKARNLLDDDQQMNDKMASMSMQQPLTPQGESRPIKRTDTETSDTDVFVDAEG